jgi:glycerophosphoryl diester phosphodiesterase
MAHAMGADYLEQDVVATRDGVLIVFHDLYLDDLTDVGEHFPGRARQDGRHYCVDFDLSEIQQLRVRERRRPGSSQALYPGRFPLAGGEFGIPTLEEELRFIQGLNQSTGRRAGVYPELKDPAWHRAHGIDLSGSLLEALARHGYTGRTAPVFVQCFDSAELRRLRADLGSALRLVQLLDGEGHCPDGAALREIAGYADAIGPALRLLTGAAGTGSTGLVASAHVAGLHVHPFTLRADRLPAGVASFQALLHRVFIDEGADGAFTDFPDQVGKFLASAGLRESH